MPRVCVPFATAPAQRRLPAAANAAATAWATLFLPLLPHRCHRTVWLARYQHERRCRRCWLRHQVGFRCQGLHVQGGVGCGGGPEHSCSSTVTQTHSHGDTHTQVRVIRTTNKQWATAKATFSHTPRWSRHTSVTAPRPIPSRRIHTRPARCVVGPVALQRRRTRRVARRPRHVRMGVAHRRVRAPQRRIQRVGRLARLPPRLPDSTAALAGRRGGE